MMRFSLLCLLVATLGPLCLSAMEPEFQRQFDEEIKRNPTGDYGPVNSRPFPPHYVQQTVEGESSDWTLKDELQSLRISLFELNDETLPVALEKFSAACQKNDPEKSRLNIAFDLEALRELNSQQIRKSSFTSRDAPALLVLDYLASSFSFHYELHDSLILIRGGAKTPSF